MSGPRIESLMTLCALVIAAVTVTGAVAESPFAHLKATYEQELAALDRAYETAVSNAPGQYVQGLQSAEKKCLDGGDLDGVLIVRNERVRFEVEKALSETNLVTKPSDLSAAQTRFMDAPKRADMERMRGIGTLTRQYADALERLKVQLTKSGQIQHALSAKAELERVRPLAVAVAPTDVPDRRVPPAPVLSLSSRPSAKPVVQSAPSPRIAVKQPPTFDPKGVWIKVDTGTRFQFSTGGRVSAPDAMKEAYRNGKWRISDDVVILTFNDEIRRFRVQDGELCEEPGNMVKWRFRRE